MMEVTQKTTWRGIVEVTKNQSDEGWWEVTPNTTWWKMVEVDQNGVGWVSWN
jgi:hypothetical protein